MRCTNCGCEVKDENYCPVCGQKVDYSYKVESPTGERKDYIEIPDNKFKILAIIGFSVAMTSIMFCILPIIGIIVSVCGIIFSAIGLKTKSKKGFAIAGLITSIFTALISLIITLSLGTTFSVLKRQNKRAALKSAETVYLTAKSVLMEYAYTEELDGYVTYDGDTCTTTVIGLVKMHELERNPFKYTTTDGGMTISYNKETDKFKCSITGTINGYEIIFNETSQTFSIA